MSARERGHVLTKASFLIRDKAEELATLEARNGGKPIGGARAEIDIVANTYEYWGGAANKIFGETIPIVPPGLDVTLREPVGPCVLISPWNFPAVIANWKVAPALACGNTAVLKPASQTPLTALAIADLLMEAGLPEGTLSVLPGPGSTTAAALIADPRVAKIGFTGSTEVGTQVMAAAAANITRVSLELGGKSANVVFDDADLDVAIPKSLWSVFDNAGQDCCARSRQFVQRPIYDEYVERFSKATEAIALGEPLDETTEMGPLISQGQRQTSLDYLAIGQEEGARLVTGGEVPEGDGYYLRPAVLADVDNSWRVAREEIFGPVVVHPALRHRGGGDPPGQRHGVRPVGLGVDAGHRQGDPRGEGDPHRRDQRELLEQRVHGSAVRRLQAEWARSRDGDARGGALHRGEERVLQRGVSVRARRTGRTDPAPSR